MRLLGLYLSFTSVLTVAYSLFLQHGYGYGRSWIMSLGLLIGLADLVAAYLLMQERRAGLALAVFLFALTVGLSGYFLGMQYFGAVQGASIIPNMVIAVCALLGFLVSMSMSPFRHEIRVYEQQEEQVDKQQEV